MHRHQQNMTVQKASFKEGHSGNISDHFDVQSVIGEGVFSTAYRAVDKATGKVVAVKKYKPENLEQNQRFQRQVQILQELRTPFSQIHDLRFCNNELRKSNVEDLCLQMLACSGEWDPLCYIALEIGECDLAEYAKKQPVLARQGIRQLSQNLLRGAAALHAKGLVHLDIKPQNFMLFGNQWKLIDVEGCIHAGKGMSKSSTAVAFTPGYCSPEFAKAYLKPQDVIEIIYEMDVWSVGITIAEVATLNSPLQDMFSQLQRQGQTFQQASESVITWLANTRQAPAFQTGGMDVSFQNLLYKWMLVPDVKERRQLAECMNHDFFFASDAMQTASHSCCIPRAKSDPDAIKPQPQPGDACIPFARAKSDPSPNRPQPGGCVHPQVMIASSLKQTNMDILHDLLDCVMEDTTGLCSPRPLPSPKPPASNSQCLLPCWVWDAARGRMCQIEPQETQGSSGNVNDFPEGHSHSPSQFEAPKANSTYEVAKEATNTLGQVWTTNAKEMRTETEQHKHQQDPSRNEYLLTNAQRPTQLPTLLGARQGWVSSK